VEEMTDLAQTLVEQEEGCELTAYRDTRGFCTIGYGHLLDNAIDWSNAHITQDQAEEWLGDDMQKARELATGFPHFATLNEVRQAVLISMCFQMGDKPLHWPDFCGALDRQDYPGATEAGLDSLWASQTPNRAKREMQMLSTGLWVDKV
jgi:lysozyme